MTASQINLLITLYDELLQVFLKIDKVFRADGETSTINGTVFKQLKEIYNMALDQNEKRFIAKLVEALKLLDADEKDIKKISAAKRIDEDFLSEAGNIFNETEACDVCRHAFHSWRRTLDDDTVLSFIEDWIQWKRQNKDPVAKARVVKMRKRL